MIVCAFLNLQCSSVHLHRHNGWPNGRGGDCRVGDYKLYIFYYKTLLSGTRTTLEASMSLRIIKSIHTGTPSGQTKTSQRSLVSFVSRLPSCVTTLHVYDITICLEDHTSGSASCSFNHPHNFSPNCSSSISRRGSPVLAHGIIY